MAWNGSDGGAVNSTQRTQNARDAKNAKGCEGGHAGAGSCARLRRCFATYPPNASRSAAHFVTLPKWWRGAVALAIVVVGGGLAWWWVGGRGSHADGAPRTSRPTERRVEDAAPYQTKAVALKRNPPNAGERSRGTHDSAEPTTALPPHKQIVEMISIITNADGSVLERFRTADGKTRSRQSAPKPVFDNASDQVIAMAVSGAASGGSMPPMPMMDNADEAFSKSLEKEIVINDDDSEKVKALKREVMAVREEMRQLIAEGQSFTDVMKEHRDMVNRNAELRKEAMRILEEFVESGDADGARECLEKVNAALGEAGIDGIEMPMSREERRAAIRERNTNAENK